MVSVSHNDFYFVILNLIYIFVYLSVGYIFLGMAGVKVVK